MSKEAMNLALKALEIEDMACRYEKEPTPEHITKAITALREALAEQPAQQEPVVFYRCNGCGHAYEQVHPTSCDCMEADGFDRVEYYTYPPVQQEPVSFLDWYDNAHWGNEDFKAGCWRAWDAALAQRTWQGLTDEEVINVVPDDDTPMSLGEAFSKFAELIEAKLKEKNT